MADIEVDEALEEAIDFRGEPEAGIELTADLVGDVDGDEIVAEAVVIDGDGEIVADAAVVAAVILIDAGEDELRGTTDADKRVEGEEVWTAETGFGAARISVNVFVLAASF